MSILNGPNFFLKQMYCFLIYIEAHQVFEDLLYVFLLPPSPVLLWFCGLFFTWHILRFFITSWNMIFIFSIASHSPEHGIQFSASVGSTRKTFFLLKLVPCYLSSHIHQKMNTAIFLCRLKILQCFTMFEFCGLTVLALWPLWVLGALSNSSIWRQLTRRNS